MTEKNRTPRHVFAERQTQVNSSNKSFSQKMEGWITQKFPEARIGNMGKINHALIPEELLKEVWINESTIIVGSYKRLKIIESKLFRSFFKTIFGMETYSPKFSKSGFIDRVNVQQYLYVCPESSDVLIQIVFCNQNDFDHVSEQINKVVFITSLPSAGGAHFV